MLAFPERYSYAHHTRYALVVGEAVDHVDHCINGMRQSLMCTADLTPNVWRWNNERQRSEVRFDTAHSCRSYEDVQTWAAKHALPYELGPDRFNESLAERLQPSREDLAAAGYVDAF